MIRKIEIKASSVELATEQALVALGVSRENVEIEVLSKGGIFSKAEVRVTTIETITTRVGDFINGVLERMGLSARCSAVDNDNTIYINIEGNDSGVSIGYRGETLDALQYLALTFLNQEKYDSKKIVVDSENYREKRKETLTALAFRLAEKAQRTCRKVKLEPMNPMERRIIHSALSESEIASTTSEGEDPNRYVVIIPKGVEIIEDDRDDRGNRGRDSRGRDNNRRYGDRNNNRSFDNNRGNYDRNRSSNSNGGYSNNHNTDGNQTDTTSINQNNSTPSENDSLKQGDSFSSNADSSTHSAHKFGYCDRDVAETVRNDDRSSYGSRDNNNRGGFGNNDKDARSSYGSRDNGNRGSYGNRDNDRRDYERRERPSGTDVPEVEDGKVFRGYYTEPDTFQKAEVKKSGPPKFKSFGGAKKF